jgi:hypothetical protein
MKGRAVTDRRDECSGCSDGQEACTARVRIETLGNSGIHNLCSTRIKFGLSPMILRLAS